MRPATSNLRRVVIVALTALVACTGSGDTGDELTPTTPEAQPTPDENPTLPEPPSNVGSTDGSTTDTTADPTPDSPPEADSTCDTVDRVRLVRSQSTPGGHRVHLHVTDPDGGGVEPSDVERCVTVTDERLGDLSVSAASAPHDDGATLIVARWSRTELDASRIVIDEMLGALPLGERIAVWAWSDDVMQVVGATTDRDRITRRLDAVWTVDDATPVDVETAAEIASEEWEDYADDTLSGVRYVVFVAPELDLGERPDIDRDVVVDHWIVRSGDGGRVVEIGDGLDVVTAAQRVAGGIVRDRSVPLTVVDVCDDGESLDLTLSVGQRELRDFGIGDAASEHVGLPCDLDARPAVTPDPLTRIEVTFDGDQRGVFDEAVAIADDLTGLDRFETDVDPEWSGSISFDGGTTRAAFDASFRGQSSIECSRRNWSIDLDGGDARHPIADTGTDEFVLASLCNDEGYVNTLVGAAVMSEFDVWAQARGTGAFEVDDEARGVYLVIEDPKVDLRFETSRVRTVLRRRYDALGRLPDIEYVADLTSNDDESILSVYDELVGVAASTSGDDTVAAMRSRFDLDQYLRWTAIMSLLGSGDHIDELYFVGSESVDAQHEPIIWFTVNGWDPDDLFAPCHRNGRLAIDDPNGLLSCTESLLDRELFADPVVYDLYADVLADVLDSMTPERFTTIATESAAEVTRHLGDMDVAAASVELSEPDPGVITPDSAIAAVDAAADGLIDRFADRHLELSDLLAEYDDAN